MTGAERIMRERHRQIDVEGYDASHDDDTQHHAAGQLIEAAVAYLIEAAPRLVLHHRDERGYMLGMPDPWPPEWNAATHDKRTRHTSDRCLEIAGALIAAELDRRHRAMKEPLNR